MESCRATYGRSEGPTGAGLGLTNWAGDYSVAVQDAAAFLLWQQRGWEPWQADDYWCARYE